MCKMPVGDAAGQASQVILEGQAAQFSNAGVTVTAQKTNTIDAATRNRTLLAQMRPIQGKRVVHSATELPGVACADLDLSCPRVAGFDRAPSDMAD